LGLKCRSRVHFGRLGAAVVAVALETLRAVVSWNQRQSPAHIHRSH